jgi:hypothetical protein
VSFRKEKCRNFENTKSCGREQGGDSLFGKGGEVEAGRGRMVGQFEFLLWGPNLRITHPTQPRADGFGNRNVEAAFVPHGNLREANQSGESRLCKNQDICNTIFDPKSGRF